MQVILEAVQELREAKDVLRRGNIIKGVQRYENAKRALYQAMGMLTEGNIIVTNALSDHPLREQFDAFLQAGSDFGGAYDAYKISGTDSRAALGLVKAEKKLISELDHLERCSN
ncbi:hypothetical protein [Deinococcus peraridilitoris]|nr:hypothetical protein [Deinococcus peraridilitoris]